MNTLVPESHIPSHQGPDAQSIDPTVDVVTMAVKVPETIGHLHYWAVQLTRLADRSEVLPCSGSTRIAPDLLVEWVIRHQYGAGTHGRSGPTA
jgi:glyceraldehyde-3-phosphate dehydrogenase (NAD(P))